MVSFLEIIFQYYSHIALITASNINTK